jgi:DNA gyrase/topoisomerase IV subunit B
MKAVASRSIFINNRECQRFSSFSPPSIAAANSIAKSTRLRRSSWCRRHGHERAFRVARCHGFREGQIYNISFQAWWQAQPEAQVIGDTNKHGSNIRFLSPIRPSSPTVEFKWDTIYNHLQEEAFLLKKVHFLLKDERDRNEHEFFYENGFASMLAYPQSEQISFRRIVDFEDKTARFKSKWPLQWCASDYNEHILSYANSVRHRRWRNP